MSNPVLIIGESGTGKSTSLRNLDPETTYLCQAIKKPLPFRGWKTSYQAKSESNEGNLFVSDNVGSILALMKHISINRTEIKTLILDDVTYIMSNQFMRRATETGFNKFSEIGSDFFHLVEKIGEYRDDLTIVFMGHSETKEDGKSGIKTAGKMLDTQYSIAGIFTIVLETFVESGQYKFITQNNGRNCAKSPMGMFDGALIDNDLNEVIKQINDY